MSDSETLKGKKILVTGAGSGIGRATAIFLSELGADIIMVSRNAEKLKGTIDRMQGVKHQIISFDLRKFDQYDELFVQAAKEEKLDGMIHCAGLAKAVPLKVITPDIIDELMETNFYSFILLVKYFSKKKYSREGASIVGCSAVNVHYPQKCMSIYQASKAALEASVSGLASELYLSRRIRINSMVIGPMVTPMAGFADGDLSMVGHQSEVTPNLMGMGDPIKAAKMAAFLLGEDSDYTTGRNFYVDGGRL